MPARILVRREAGVASVEADRSTQGLNGPVRGRAAHELEDPRRRGKDLIAAGVALAVAVVARGTPIPAGAEEVYLPLLQQRAGELTFANDWTFSAAFREHFLFNLVISPLARFIDIEALAWIGRLATWTAVAWLVIQIGRKLGVTRWASVFAIALWIGLGHSLGVADETVFTGFQAKTVAWPLALGAYLAALNGRVALLLALAGLSFSFHPAVGLWGAGAVVFAAVFMPDLRRTAVKFSPVLFLFALPGAVMAVLDRVQAGLTSAQASFLVTERLAHHLDPFYFARRGYLIIGLMSVFLLIWTFTRRHSPEMRLTLFVHLSLLGSAVTGLLARFMEFYGYLMLMPMRAFSVLVPLLALLLLTRLPSEWAGWRREGRRPSVAGIGYSVAGLLVVVATLVLWNPVIRMAGDVAENFEAHTSADADSVVVMDWISENTAPTTIVLSPPWIGSSHYHTQRSQFVNWQAIPYDRVAEWLERLGRTTADASVWEGLPSETVLTREFEGVSLEEFDRLASEYEVSVLLSSRSYASREAMFCSGEWCAYELR